MATEHAVRGGEERAPATLGLVFRTRDLCVRQRTQMINAIREHMVKYGRVAARRPDLGLVAWRAQYDDLGTTLPPERDMFRIILTLLYELGSQIANVQ